MSASCAAPRLQMVAIRESGLLPPPVKTLCLYANDSATSLSLALDNLTTVGADHSLTRARFVRPVVTTFQPSVANYTLGVTPPPPPAATTTK